MWRKLVERAILPRVFVRNASSEAEPKFVALCNDFKPGFSLPSVFYQPDVHRIDMQQMWSKSWLFAGLSCEIPNKNDYFTYKVGDNSVIIVRGKDGKCKAFHNICRHRGSVVCLEEKGSAANFICPYHQWTYDSSSGDLRHARDMGDKFEEQKRSYGLLPAHCHELHGFIWVCLAPDKPYFDFEECASVLTPQMIPHEFSNAKIAFHKTYSIEANWKLVYENNRECYHCNKGHPEYIRSNYDTAFTYQTDNQGNTVRVPDKSFKGFEEISSHIDYLDNKWKSSLGVGCTVDATFPGAGWYRATRSPMRKGWLVESIDGKPICKKLMGTFRDYEQGSMRIHTFPNHWTHASSDHAVVTRLTPTAWNRTEAKVMWIVHKDSEENKDYYLEEMVPFWQKTSEQDWKLCEDNHRGVMNPHHRIGPLSPIKEKSVEKFFRWYINSTLGMMNRK